MQKHPFGFIISPPWNPKPNSFPLLFGHLLGASHIRLGGNPLHAAFTLLPRLSFSLFLFFSCVSLYTLLFLIPNKTQWKNSTTVNYKKRRSDSNMFFECYHFKYSRTFHAILICFIDALINYKIDNFVKIFPFWLCSFAWVEHIIVWNFICSWLW